ncbi:MAG: hypothetical protein MI757_22095, partial [Pirellulales bacterium]|nr:hypothetical protein [Pirellulales bacterium]
TLSALQQQFRNHCVLHVTWKGHPGRYYALHDAYVRSSRRIRDQAVRLRSNELPVGIDLENLYFGDGKLELADVYSHKFLSLPMSRRAEIPTLKRSRKDPSLFVDLDTDGGSLTFRFDARVNSKEQVKRRRKLFEHVDGNFYLHASLYRVVDKRIKVEVLRLGSP